MIPADIGGVTRSDFVDAAEVIVRVPERDCRPVVLPFLREAIGQSSEAAASHADAEVRAFDDGRSDAVGIGITADWDPLHGHFGGRVLALAIGHGLVDPDEHCVVHIVSEGVRNGSLVRRKPSVVIWNEQPGAMASRSPSMKLFVLN